MTIKDDIRSAINADPSLQAIAATGDDAALASAISLTRPGNVRLTTTEVLEVLGLVDGAEFMSALRKRAAVDNADGRQADLVLRLMDTVGVSLASKEARKFFDALEAATVLKKKQRKALDDRDTETFNPTPDQVAKALRKNRKQDGTEDDADTFQFVRLPQPPGREVTDTERQAIRDAREAERQARETRKTATP